MRKWKFWITLLGLMLSFFITGCNQNGPSVYTLIVRSNNTEWGLVDVSTVDNTAVEAGKKVIFAAIPKKGYYVEEIVCLEDSSLLIQNIRDNDWQFLMPAEDITLTVYFAEIPPETYTVTFDSFDDTKATIKTDKASYTEGEKVTVTAASNFAFDISLSVSDMVEVTTVTENKKWSFDMPAEDVTVKVDISGYRYKVNVTDGNSKNGIKLEFANIPEEADRRDIYLGTGNNKKLIHRAGSWQNTNQIKAESYFYPLTETGTDYVFTVEYIRNDIEPWECLSSETITIKAQGGIGSIECINESKIDFKIDEDGNFTWITKPVVNDNVTTSGRMIVYGFEFFDIESDAYSQLEWAAKYDYFLNTVVYNNNFNIFDIICGWDGADSVKNKEHIDRIVNGKKVVVSTTFSYQVLDSSDEWNEVEIFSSDYWGSNPKNLFTLEPSPLLGTWMEKSKAYTFYQNKVVVEDAVSKTEYPYTYADNTVSFNGESYEFDINGDRTIITLKDDDDNIKRFTRSMFGSELEAGYENAEIKVENNTIKFVQAPGVKTVPEGITGYRISICKETTPGDFGEWLNDIVVSSLEFNKEFNVDEYIYEQDINGENLIFHFYWGTYYERDGFINIHDDIIIPNYQIAPGYELPKTSIDGTVVTMTKPGSKILDLYPNTDHYTVFIHNGVNKHSDWIGYKEFALTDNITFDLCDLGIDPERIINNQVNLCLELKAANENLEKRLTDDNWVPFSGYKYNVELSENSAGINNGISINMSGVPSEAKWCQIHILKGAIGHQIYWTDNPSELKKTSFFYPFVNANTEYTIQVSYYWEDIKLSQSIIKLTPKGGLGELLPVNANDVSCKVEGKSLIWETKPTFVNHTGGYVSIGFFGENWDGYYGEVHIDYALLKTSAYTKIDLSENVDVDGFMVYFEKPIPRKGVLQYTYHADDGSGIYDGYSSEIEFKNHAFEYVPPVPKTISIEDVVETVVIAKNYPWVDGVQDTSAEMINYEVSLDVTELYGSDLPKRFDEIHLIWNGVSDRDIKKLWVGAIDRSEAADYWTELSYGELVKENIKAGTPFSSELYITLIKDCIENINLVIHVDKEDVVDEPTITKVSK